MPTSHQLAIITGTTSGIGHALVQVLTSRNWHVVGIARREAPIDHPSYTHITADLGSNAELKGRVLPQLRALLAGTTGGPVALVNNAAAIGELSWMQGFDVDRLDNLFAVNAQAPMLLMGLVADAVPSSVPLRVVNVSSGAAHTPLPGLADYCATKAALRLAGQTMAAEFEREGRTPEQASVFSYEPGLVDTAMQNVAREADPERFPGYRLFQEFATEGLLNSPTDVVAEIVGFVESVPAVSFTERRYSPDESN